MSGDDWQYMVLAKVAGYTALAAIYVVGATVILPWRVYRRARDGYWPD